MEKQRQTPKSYKPQESSSDASTIDHLAKKVDIHLKEEETYLQERREVFAVIKGQILRRRLLAVGKTPFGKAVAKFLERKAKS